MALEEFPIELFATVQDRDGNKFNLSYFSTSTTLLTAGQLWEDWVAALPTVTKCQIIKTGYTYSQVETEDTPLEEFGEGEKKAEINIKLVTGDIPLPGQTKTGKIIIPAPLDELFLAEAGDGATIIDVNNADLQAYLNLWYAGLGVLPSLTLSDFQTVKDPSVVANWKGKKTTYKSRKG